jgi:hypothetical protein
MVIRQLGLSAAILRFRLRGCESIKSKWPRWLKRKVLFSIAPSARTGWYQRLI